MLHEYEVEGGMKHKFPSILKLSFAGIAYSAAAETAAPPSQWMGLSGNDLCVAVARTNSPTNYVTQYSGDTGFYEIFKLTHGDDERGCYINQFSSSIIPYGIDGGAPDNFELLTIIPPHWWNAVTVNFTSVSRDLYNLIPSPEGFPAIKSDAPPGVVENEETSSIPGLKCKIGIGSIGTCKVRLWEPPDEIKGDVARCLMYMAIVYPNGLRRFESGNGIVWSENTDEIFTPAYSRQLLIWHRTESPSMDESNRNDVFFQFQGNRNPFVDYPELAELLWGNRMGECLLENNEDDINTSTEGSTPLKAIYSLKDDNRINLYSSYVPEDASWSVDGVPVKENYILTQSLGVGLHTLRFNSETWSGMLNIEIR